MKGQGGSTRMNTKDKKTGHALCPVFSSFVFVLALPPCPFIMNPNQLAYLFVILLDQNLDSVKD